MYICDFVVGLAKMSVSSIRKIEGNIEIVDDRDSISEENRILAYFTRCDVFHLLAQKLTHY